MVKKTLSFALGLILLGAPGAFATIALDSSGGPGTIFQQTVNSPCVIGDASCQQPSVDALQFDYTQGFRNTGHKLEWQPYITGVQYLRRSV